MTFPRRGDIYWVALDPTVGTEVAKTRPAVIISNDVGNQHSSRVIVAPLTSQGIERVYPFEVLLAADESDLATVSKVMLDQIRSVDKWRLRRYVSTLSTARMQRVDAAIRLSLSV